MTGRQSKRIGKDGERNAKKLLTHLGCHIAMSEVSGLAGDDVFVQDDNGKWWSVEVKHTKAYKDDYLEQAKRQAAERFDAIQEKLGNKREREIYEVLGLDSFTKNDWILMWHPRGKRVAADEWFAFYQICGTVHLAVLGGRSGWCL